MCTDVVVGVVDHFARVGVPVYLLRNYEGGGVWYVVGGPCWSPPLCLFSFYIFSFSALSYYAGTHPECPGISTELRNYLDGSLWQRLHLHRG